MPGGAWFLSYGLLGLTQNGLAPILLPLAARGGALSGMTYAAFSLAGLVAPFLGTWADRSGRHRDLLVWGCTVGAICFGMFGFAAGPARIVLAAGAGLGMMAATTAGNVLAIQGRSEAEWDDRVGVLQRFISAGQVIGLLSAGLLVALRPADGFLAGAAALVLGAGVAAASAPGRRKRSSEAKPRPRPLTGGEAGVPGPQQHHHHFGWSELAGYLRVITPGLRRFLLIWLLTYTAMNGVAVLFPLAMTRQFHMSAAAPSVAYAAGVATSLLFYPAVGRAAHRVGGGRVLVSGLALRLLIFSLLAVFSLVRTNWSGIAVLGLFAVTQVVWPLLGIGANVLSVRLAPAARGEAVGLFNAATSLGSSIGAAIGGAVFGLAGYGVLCAAGALCVAIGLGLSAIWGLERAARAPSPNPGVG